MQNGSEMANFVRLKTPIELIRPHDFETRIGFDQIRQLIVTECQGQLAKRMAERIKLITDPQRIAKLQNQTFELVKLISAGVDLPNAHFNDFEPQLKRSAIENAALDATELYALKLSLNTLLKLNNTLKQHTDQVPEVATLLNMAETDKNLIALLDFIFDDNGLIKDSASTELQKIRKELNGARHEVRRKTDAAFEKAKNNLMAADGGVTIRNNRLVIPIAAEYKRKYHGFIHDESATGQTVFVEPAETFELNNRVRELEFTEKRELYIILRNATASVGKAIPLLEKNLQFLTLIDFIRAKARLAIKFGAQKVNVNPKPIIDWIRARHPLLEQRLKALSLPIVPYNIKLNRQTRIMVISGPNAGGKSVLLKTVGLLQYMFQCGLPVPVSEGSTFGIFLNFFLDIGDQQSLESDLSTYSSHLNNMKQVLAFANKSSLVLIDEFGSGTEPSYGAALAEAMLTELNNLQPFGIVTTHYTNLKSLADQTDGLINGSMRFDTEQLKPLFILDAGTPGSSFTFEIAKRIGLPENTINTARGLTDKQHEKLDKLLSKINQSKNQYDNLNAQLEPKLKELNRKTEEYEELRKSLQIRKNEFIREARAEAKQIIANTNRLIESTIREIKEASADKEIVKDLRQQVNQFAKTLDEPIGTQIPTNPKNNEDYDKPNIESEIIIGSTVRIIDTDTLAEVTKIKGDKAEVNIGALKSEVALSRLELANPADYKKIVEVKKHAAPKKVSTINTFAKAMAFSPEVDFRGMRADEAMREVDILLDNAILAGAPYIKIIHGKGDGVLRKIIRQRLKSFKAVTTIADGHPDSGGDGITIANLY